MPRTKKQTQEEGNPSTTNLHCQLSYQHILTWRIMEPFWTILCRFLLKRRYSRFFHRSETIHLQSHSVWKSLGVKSFLTPFVCCLVLHPENSTEEKRDQRNMQWLEGRQKVLDTFWWRRARWVGHFYDQLLPHGKTGTRTRKLASAMLSPWCN